MTISDLGYLEEVSQSNNLTGGLDGFGFPLQLNIASTRQYAAANSQAVAFFGDATAVSVATNGSLTGQRNSIS
jgi:hypothetical protein